MLLFYNNIFYLLFYQKIYKLRTHKNLVKKDISGIQVTRKLMAKLRSIGKFGDTYESIIWNLINNFEKKATKKVKEDTYF